MYTVIDDRLFVEYDRFFQPTLSNDGLGLTPRRLSIWLMALPLNLLLKIKHSFISLLFHNFIRNDSYYITVSHRNSHFCSYCYTIENFRNRFYHLYENCMHYFLTNPTIFFKLIFGYSSIFMLFDGDFWGTIVEERLCASLWLASILF